jgi:hypothetical protein
MEKREIGSLGLSPRSVEQLERVIDTADMVLYPAHSMIGGWRMFFAAVILAVYGLCYGLWWVAALLPFSELLAFRHATF